MKPLKTERDRASDIKVAQPFSLQAEQAIIGALLSDPYETFAVIGDQLQPDHFYDPFCRVAYEKAMGLLSSGKMVDVVLLSSELDGLLALPDGTISDRLAEIYMSYPAAANIAEWSGLIIAKAVERNLGRAGARMQQIAHAQEMSADDKLAEAHRMLSEVGTAMASDTVVTAPQMVVQTLSLVEAYSKMGGQLTGLSTGITQLDEKTCGLQKGDLVILAARPSMGKTSLALSIAKAVAAHQDESLRRGVMVFSLEMGVTQIGMRWLSILHGIPMSQLRSGKISPEQWGSLNKAVEQADHTPIYLEETPTMTIEQIAAKARRMHRERGLGLVIVDYLQLINDKARNNASRAERVGEISRGLKQLARELNVPVIALSQLSRALEQRQDRRPIMSDLRDSGSIEQDADVIMFLYRDQVYNPSTQDKGIAEIIIGKQRNGPLATIRVAFDEATTLFREGPSIYAADRIEMDFSGYRDPSGDKRD